MLFWNILAIRRATFSHAGMIARDLGRRIAFILVFYVIERASVDCSR